MSSRFLLSKYNLWGLSVVTLILFSVLASANLVVAQEAEESQQQEATADSNTAAQWLVSCNNRINPERLTCGMSQSLVVAQTGARLFSANIEYINGAHEMFIQFPFGIDFNQDIAVLVDDAEVTAVKINTCDTRGCYSRLPMTDDIIQKMKKGLVMVISTQNVDGQTIRFSIDLKGFAQSYDLMAKNNK